MADNDFSWSNQPGLHRWNRNRIDRGAHYDGEEGVPHYGFGHHHHGEEERRIRAWVAHDRDWREDEYDRRRVYIRDMPARGDWSRTRMDEHPGISGERRQEGTHRGKGPKGYVRSSERIREDVYDRLSYDPRIDASDISIKVEGSEVTLSGVVHSREEKYRAEDLVETISGVRSVQNNLRIEKDISRGPHLTHDRKIW